MPNNSPAPTADSWVPYTPDHGTPWNRQRVVHLHRRAAFAATWEEQELDLEGGPQQAVDRLINQKNASLNGPLSEREFETLAGTIGDAAMASGSPARLKAWWIYRMLYSPDPLGERLTLMWHNHFATSNRKVDDLVLMRQQNDLFREYARAPFGELLQAVLKHPAMLLWLDADANRKGKPNENLARETLELFTLGVGNYAESDVQTAARALTGWGVADGRFTFRETRHDASEKTLLGKTGNLNGDDLVAAILVHPTTANRLAWRICRTFFGDAPVSDANLTALADGLRARNLDVGWAVDTVLRSQLFFSQRSLRNRIDGPVDWAIGALRALELTNLPPSTLLLAEWTTRMGQDLFYPPNVGGWSEGRAWLSSQSVVARAKFGEAMVEGRLWCPPLRPDLQKLASRRRNSDDLHECVSWFMELLWGESNRDTVDEIVDAAVPQKEGGTLGIAVAILLARPESQLS